MGTGKKFIIIGEEEGSWEQISSSVVFVTTFRAARIELLEKTFDYLVLDSVADGDEGEISNFIEGLRSHPLLSTLKVFVCLSAVENSKSGIADILGLKSIEVISGSDYFIRNTSLMIDQTKGESFEMQFLWLKEDCAKALAWLKTEINKEPSSRSTQ
jgi:hypothetical protein